MISVVMMSYLGDYPGARTNPILKFNRAVQSIVDQTYKEWELIIISDGCELTNAEYEKHWSNDSRIKLIKTEKSKSTWPGLKKQLGVDLAQNDWICYIDSDDMYLEDRLKNCLDVINDHPGTTVFFDNTLIFGSPKKGYPSVGVRGHHEGPYGLCYKYNDLKINGYNVYTKYTINSSGTWSLLHKKDLHVKWDDSEGRGEDIIFTRKIKKLNNWKFVSLNGYLVCHDPGKYDI